MGFRQIDPIVDLLGREQLRLLMGVNSANEVDAILEPGVDWSGRDCNPLRDIREQMARDRAARYGNGVDV